MTGHRPAIALNRRPPVLTSWQGPAQPAERSSTWTGGSAAHAAVQIPTPGLPRSRPLHLRHPPFPRHLPLPQHTARAAAHGRTMSAGSSAAHADRPGPGLLLHSRPPSILGLSSLPRLRKRSQARPDTSQRPPSMQCLPRRPIRPFHRLHRLPRSDRDLAGWEDALSPRMSSSRCKGRSSTWPGPRGIPSSSPH